MEQAAEYTATLFRSTRVVAADVQVACHVGVPL